MTFMLQTAALHQITYIVTVTATEQFFYCSFHLNTSVLLKITY